MPRIDENKILKYIKEYLDKNKIAPTQEEIMAEFKIAKGTVKAAIDRLVMNGKVTRKYDASGRQIERALTIGAQEVIDYENTINPFVADPELRKEIRLIVLRYRKNKAYIERIMSRDSLERSRRPDGTPHGTDIVDTTGDIASERADCKRELERQLKAIDDAKKTIDPIYRDAVWDYCTQSNATQVSITLMYPVSERTLVRYQTKFYAQVAKNLHYII